MRETNKNALPCIKKKKNCRCENRHEAEPPGERSMMFHPKILIKIDNAFWLFYQGLGIVFRILREFQSPGNSRKVVILKFLGMGSIIRLTSILDHNHVDKDNTLICTFAQNRELCRILGYKNQLLIRDNNLGHMLYDLFFALFLIRSFHPGLLLDYERCSNAVGLFRMLVVLITSCKSIAFSHGAAHQDHNLDKIYSAKHQSLSSITGEIANGLEKSKVQINRQTLKILENKILVNINASEHLLERRYPLSYFKDVIEGLHQWNPATKISEIRYLKSN